MKLRGRSTQNVMMRSLRWLTRILLGVALLLSLLLFLPRTPLTPEGRLGLCRGESTCLFDAFKKQVAETNPERALALLADLSRRNADVARNAHDYAHHIGYATYSKYSTITERLSECRDGASGGCYHGVMMMYISREKPSEQAMSQVCQPIKARAARAVYKDCLHGLGHGLMMANLLPQQGAGGLPEIKAALARCRAIQGGGSYEQYHCDRGVFMEYQVAASIKTFHYLKQPVYPSDDAQWPCNAVLRDERNACYDYHGQQLVFQMGYVRGFASCEAVGGEAAQHCAANIGRNLNSGALEADQKSILDTCNQAASRSMRSACIGGAAAYSLYYGRNLDAAVKLCRSAGHAAASCLSRVRREALEEYEMNPEEVRAKT